MSHGIVSTHDSWKQVMKYLIASMPDQENCPRIWYDEESDRLTVILRHNNYRGITNHFILPGVDVLLLSYRKPDEESFTGILLSQGVQRLVEEIYQENSGEDRMSYRIRHNQKQILTTIARIFRAVLDRHEPKEPPIPFFDQINQMLAEEPHLAVHIPL